MLEHMPDPSTKGGGLRPPAAHHIITSLATINDATAQHDAWLAQTRRIEDWEDSLRIPFFLKAELVFVVFQDLPFFVFCCYQLVSKGDTDQYDCYGALSAMTAMLLQFARSVDRHYEKANQEVECIVMETVAVVSMTSWQILLHI